MDSHAELLVTYIKRILKESKRKLPATHPNKDQIIKGSKYLWKHYFSYAYRGEEYLSSVIIRVMDDLKKDTEEVRCIHVYRRVFGIPLLNIREKNT